MQRREFLLTTAAALTAPLLRAADDAKTLSAEDRARGRDLVGLMGITTGSFAMHQRPPVTKPFALIELPKIMRDELDLKVIDLMTATFPYRDREYCERFRNEAEKTGRIVTNLKMNLEVDPASGDADVRRAAIDAYKTAIDSAAILGCRWVRPAPGAKPPDLELLAESYRELIEYGAPKGISLLIENNGWMSRDANALPELYEAIGPGVGVQPDTGNWAPAVRDEGLTKAFPLAVSCDFKAFKLGPDGSHADYDLRKCFDIGRRAGFRGPWCFEHFNADLPSLLKEFVVLRDLLSKWTAENEKTDGQRKPGV